MEKSKIEHLDDMLLQIRAFAENVIGVKLAGEHQAAEIATLTTALNKLESEIKNIRTTQKQLIDSRNIKDDIIIDLLNSAPDGIIAIDENGLIVLANEQAELLFGFTFHELVGRRIEMLIPERYRSSHSHDTQHFFGNPSKRKMGGYKQELYGSRKNGQEFPVDISLSYGELNGRKLAICAVRDITEIKKLNEEIAQSEKRLKKITSVIPAIVYQAIIDGGRIIRYTFFSEGAKSILGVDPADVYRDSSLVYSKIHPEDFQYTLDAISQSNEAGSPFSISFRMIMDDGSLKWFNVIGIAERNDDGTFTRTGCYIDITESRNTKKQLEDSLLFNRCVLDSLTSQIVVMENNGEVLDVNKAWEDFTVKNKDSVLAPLKKGTNFFELFRAANLESDPNAREICHAIKAVISREKDVVELQYSTSFRNEQRWYLLRVMAFYNDTPNIVISHRDITDLKQVEVDLRESELRYKAVLDTTDEMINTVSLDGEIIWTNEAWKKNLRYPDKDLKNKKLTDLLTAETRKGIEERLQMLRSNHTVRDFAGSMVTKYGDVIDVKGTIVPYFEKNVLKGTQGFFRNITEMTKAQAERIKVESRLTRILDNMVTGCMVISRDWRFLYINGTAAGQAFRDKSELIGKPLFKLFPAAENSQIVGLLRKGMEEGGHIEGIESFTFDNGICKWFEIAIEPVEEGIFVMSVDITDKKTAEDSISKHQALLSESQRIAHLGSWDLDLTTNVLIWSDEVYRIFEINTQAFGASYQAFLDLIHPEDREFVNKAYTQSLANHTLYNLVHRLKFPDGRIKYVHEQGENFYDELGEPVRTVGTVHDITQQKEAEILLQKNEQKFAQVVENISDGIMIRNSSGKIIYSNKRFLELFCLEESDVTELNFLELVADEHKAMMLENHLRRFSGAKVPWSYEFMGVRKDGQKRWFDVRVTQTIDKGKTETVQAIVRDITERKQAEDVLENQNRELKKINSELDRFVYSTSHDLRSPLLSILGLIDLCEDSQEASEISIYLGMMRTSVVRMDNTIKEILVYSRNSRMELVYELLDIRSITLAHIESILHMHGAKNISFVINIDDQAPFISDKLRVGAIINNLISNAVKYQRNEEEKPFVKFTFTADDEEGIITVEDNGEGIADDHVKKVFQMFYRHSEKSEGSGLGLYICKEIIDKMGGSIELISKSGIGSIFIVRLPNNAPIE